MGALMEATQSGDSRDVLVAVRDRLASSIDDTGTPARDLAALTRRFMDVTKEIEALDAAESEDADDAPTPDEDFNPASI